MEETKFDYSRESQSAMQQEISIMPTFCGKKQKCAGICAYNRKRLKAMLIEAKRRNFLEDLFLPMGRWQFGSNPLTKKDWKEIDGSK